MNPCSILPALAVLLGATQESLGLRFELIGSDRERGNPTNAQPGWPGGVVEIARHDSRVYWTGGAGAGQYYFKSNAGEIAELIEHYSQCRLREHQIFLKAAAARKEVRNFAGDKIDYNVLYYQLEGRGLAQSRRQGGPETFEPTLTIYLDPVGDLAALQALAIPKHVVLKSEIAGWPRGKDRGKAARTERRNWHAVVQFRDGTPASDPRLLSRVTLWHKDAKEGFDVGEVDSKGIFRGAFSDAEMTELKEARSWLTLTVGNFGTRPRGDDTLLPFEKLARDPAHAPPLKIGKPKFHYGRLLFQDGSPAVLDRKVWAGAEITVSFPFGGLTRVDREGYFKVLFTPEQFEKVKAQAEKNVYIPDAAQPRNSQARHTFPATRLSQDKEKAGELRIPKPRRPGLEKEDA